MSRRALVIAAAAAVVVPGCGRSDAPAPATSTPATTSAPATASTPATTPAPAPVLSVAERAALAERRRTEAPHFGAAGVGDDRGAVLAALHRSVLRDARRRARAGELHGRFRQVECHVDGQDAAAARLVPAAPVLRYDCLAISYRSPSPPVMVIGRPFLARVDFPRRRFAFCLFTPVGGEGTHAAATFAVQPSPACAAAPPR